VKGSGCRAVAATAIALATSLCCSIAYAQSSENGRKCLSPLQIPEDERISSCTAAIVSGSFSPFYANRAYTNRAIAYFHKGEFDRAIADFGQVIRLFPENVYAYRGRAQAYHRHGDLDLAIADYGRVIELDPNDRLVYTFRGDAYAAMDDLDHGIADFNQAIRIDPKFAPAYCARGSAYRGKGDLERAIADYNQAIELDPKFKAAYFGRGSAYEVSGYFDRAIADYDQVIQLDPKVAKAYRIRGIANLKPGSLPKSLEDLNQSGALEPKDPYTSLWLDIVAKRSNLPSRLAEASKQLDMTKWPAPIIHLFLGEMTLEEVLAAADDADAKKKKGELCEANFYGGELAFQRGTREEAARLFRLAVEDCPKTFIEWSAASAELKAINANP
jgi:lipoprotein NlpI